MRRRKFIILLGSTAAAWPLAARAQRVAGLRRVGLLMAWKESDPEVQEWLAALREALGELGWTQGQNVLFEFRWAGTDPNIMQQAAKELVLLEPDLIVSSSSPSTAFLLKQTSTIPVVFVNIVDPVGQGFAASMPRPGGNATGLVNLEPSMAGKWVELLKEVMPGVARVAIPLDYFRSTAMSFGAEVIVTPVPDIAALETFAAAQARQPNTGLVPVPSAFMQIHGNRGNDGAVPSSCCPF